MLQTGSVARRVLALLAVLALVAGCSSNASPTPSASGAQSPAASGASQAPATPAAKVGGTLTIAQAPIDGLNPLTSQSDPTNYVQSQIYSSLVAVDQNSKAIPDLAETWSQTSPTEWVFKLRHGAMWQDDNEVFAKGQSREVTADDVKFAYDTYLDATVASQRASFLASVASTTAVDKYTVKITLKAPDAFLFIQTGIPGVPIFPREAYEKYGMDGLNTHAVGSGPFKLKEYVADDHATLVRNDLYWIKPNLDSVIFRFIPDANVRLAAIQNGEVDVAWLISRKDYGTFSDPKFQLFYTYGSPTGSSASASLFMFYFNTKKDPFTDVNVRKALTLATDRAAITSQTWGDNGVATYGIAGPGMVGYDASVKDKYGTTDVAAANKLLDDAGWTLGSDGVRTKNGQRLEVTVTMTMTFPEYQTATLILADQLKAIGAALKIDAAAGSVQIPKIRKGDFQMCIINASGGVKGLNQALNSANIGASNFAQVNDPQIDTLLNQALGEVDDTKRGALFAQVQDLALAQYPVIPLARVYDKGVALSTVHDYPAAQFSLGLVNAENNAWKD